jgi:hypothetical protein
MRQHSNTVRQEIAANFINKYFYRMTAGSRLYKLVQDFTNQFKRIFDKEQYFFVLKRRKYAILANVSNNIFLDWWNRLLAQSKKILSTILSRST